MDASFRSAAQGPQVHAGFCALVGLPNAGKSTLLNRVLGRNLVAVSPKPQTTRNRIVGVKNLADPPAQLALVDTPGLQRGHNALRKYMRDEALTAVAECDLALLVLDVGSRSQRDPNVLSSGPGKELLDAVAPLQVPVVLALNKVDRLPEKPALLPLLDRLAHSGRFAEIVPISAKTGLGVDALMRCVAQALPVGPPLFPEDMYTDRAERFLAAELIREQLFLQLGEELPYASAVVVEKFEERRHRGDLVISAVVFVERESQKGIVVGKGGARIKSVGQRAREQISNLLGCPVHIKLFVKVDPDWSSGVGGLRRMGYE
jgi:GTPase